MKAASVTDIAAAFGIETGTLWLWRRDLKTSGVAGLVPEKRGPRGASKLTTTLASDIKARRARGETLRTIAAAVGVSTFSVDRALSMDTGEDARPPADPAAGTAPAMTEPLVNGTGAAAADPDPAAVPLPVLPAPADRSGERAADRCV